MAQQVVKSLIDDIDGSEATETVTFAYRGQEYEIDLNEKHARQLAEALLPYMQHGRRLSRRSRPGKAAAGARGGTADRDRIAAIRQWAKDQGIAISARGRIPQHIVEQYDAAH